MFSRLRWWTSSRTLSAPARLFSQTPIVPAKPLPPRLKINDADISISYLKGTGPGGQKINKTNSAVQIIHKPSGVVIKCQATRSQSQNAKIARSLLADRVEAQEKGDKSRVAIKAAAAKKKKASKLKKTRRKYRELGEGGKQGGADMEEEDEIEIIWDDDVKEGERMRRLHRKLSRKLSRKLVVRLNPLSPERVHDMSFMLYSVACVWGFCIVGLLHWCLSVYFLRYLHSHGCSCNGNQTNIYFMDLVSHRNMHMV